MSTHHSSPDIDNISDKINSLSPEKRKLLERYLKNQQTAFKNQHTISKREKDHNPASYAQQRLWFLDQLLDISGLYNTPWTIRLDGTLNVSSLQHSINAIIARHEILRTSFAEQENQLVQIIHTTAPFQCQQLDLSAVAQTKKDSEWQSIVATETQKPFGLSHFPLLRTVLIKLSPQQHILIITIHHIISDGWSRDIFQQELSHFYNAFSDNKPTTLPDLVVQYADYAAWQQQRLQGKSLEKQLGYWKNQLAESTELDLPIDCPRPKKLTYKGARETIQLSTQLTKNLKTLSQHNGVTLFMTLLATFQLLLHRYSGQNDITFGTPVSGRNKQEVEPLIGFFINTLILRNNFSGNPEFTELLQRVNNSCIDAYAHQDIPFEKLVEELNPPRDLNRNPFFDVLVNQFDRTKRTLNLKGLQSQSIEQPDVFAKFALILQIDSSEQTIKLDMDYQVELFSTQRIVTILDQYHYLLEQIVRLPSDTLLSGFSLLTEKTRQLIPDPTLAIKEVPQVLVLDSLLKWADCQPDNIAICYKNQQWTYRELVDSSTKLAEELIHRGLAKGDVVGITGASSFGLVANIIAVFFSGGVALTIDDQLPTKRKQSMLFIASASMLCSVGETSMFLENSTDVANIIRITVNPLTATIDNNLPILSTLQHINLPTIKGNDEAYIFFTSGSTGVPKAILGCHKGLAHFINWQKEYFKVNEKDRVAQLAHLSFDAVLRDLFTPLSSGASVCIPEVKDTLDTISWLNQENISIVHTVPSIIRLWLARQGDTVELKKLRCLFISGEPLTDDIVSDWQQTYPLQGSIINLYGATETTLVKFFCEVPDVEPIGKQALFKALPHTQGLILKTDVLCGIGEIGEIVVRTPYRTLGYFNSLEQTKTTFKTNPFRQDEHDIIYYSGDLGRYRSDGLIEVLGRIDNQIKIRGVRIELEEISTILNNHVAIVSSIVIGVKNVPSNYLIAYIVTQQNATLAASEVRDYLSQQLSLAMIPEHIIFIDRFVLTPNGKIDKNALPAPDKSRQIAEQLYVAPRTQNEEVLSIIWQDILGVERIGINDGFFELGGHSLLAVQLILRINQQFQVNFPLYSLFETPTIAGISIQLASRLKQQNSSMLSSIKTLPRKPC